MFCVSEFITCKEHRGSAAGHQYSTGISYHAEAEGKHFGVGGIALFSTVPAAVIVGTVGVIPAVCFIVFFIVGIKIIHGEAIVAGKEIDTGIVSCIIVIMIRIKASVQITGTGNTPCSVPGIPEISLQEGTEAVTVTAIPFSPSAAGRERTNLIQPAGIPGFCDQFDISKDRIVSKELQKGRIVKWRTVLMASENAGKIEAEAVHTVVDGPVT